MENGNFLTTYPLGLIDNVDGNEPTPTLDRVTGSRVSLGRTLNIQFVIQLLEIEKKYFDNQLPYYGLQEYQYQ
jgi:hypothetical protein